MTRARILRALAVYLIITAEQTRRDFSQTKRLLVNSHLC